jgi:hypothetical protein
LLLDLTSFGLYAYYWFIRNHRLAERRLGIAPTPIWHWFIPFFNVFVFYNGAAAKLSEGLETIVAGVAAYRTRLRRARGFS